MDGFLPPFAPLFSCGSAVISDLVFIPYLTAVSVLVSRPSVIIENRLSSCIFGRSTLWRAVCLVVSKVVVTVEATCWK